MKASKNLVDLRSHVLVQRSANTLDVRKIAVKEELSEPIVTRKKSERAAPEQRLAEFKAPQLASDPASSRSSALSVWRPISEMFGLPGRTVGCRRVCWFML